MKKKIQKPNNSINGAAIIVVLSFIILVAIITSSIVKVSQIYARKLHNISFRSYSAYIAEGAAARLQWLIYSYKIAHSDSGYYDPTQSSSLFETSNPFAATGKKLKLDYYDADVKCQIYDMNSGLNISGSNPIQGLMELKSIYMFNREKANLLQTIIDRLSDYVSNNIGKSVNGLSREDYTAMGFFPLPRGDKLQFREEILWIPGASSLFKTDEYGLLPIFNIIPLEGQYYYASQINFFSASSEIIMMKCNFTSEETNDIIRAREKWINSNYNGPITDFISSQTMIALKGQFSFRDSGYYTLIITALPDSETSGSRTLILSLKIGNDFSPTGNEYFQYLLY